MSMFCRTVHDTVGMFNCIMFNTSQLCVIRQKSKFEVPPCYEYKFPVFVLCMGASGKMNFLFKFHLIS